VWGGWCGESRPPVSNSSSKFELPETRAYGVTGLWACGRDPWTGALWSCECDAHISIAMTKSGSAGGISPGLLGSAPGHHLLGLAHGSFVPALHLGTERPHPPVVPAREPIQDGGS
jgi:hypothetical protein